MKHALLHHPRVRRTVVPTLLALSLWAVPKPCVAVQPNDNLANAQVIASGSSFSVNGDDGSATTEAFESASDYPFPFAHTVWYSWTPTVSGYLNVNVAPAAGAFANIGVFRGPTPNAASYLTSSYATDFIDDPVHVDAGQQYLICVGSNHQTFTFVLTGSVSPEPAFFKGETSLGGGGYYLSFAGGGIFGYYAYLSNSHFIYHFDLGYEYVFDAADGQAGVYFYDFKSSDYFYTSPTFGFPYLYDFGLQAFLYYYPDPNNPGRYNTNGVRFFYNFATGKIISK